VFLLCTYRQRTTVARYGFPNTTLQLERIDLAGNGELWKREREREKMVTLTILLHPPEKSRVGRVRIIIKYYCQHRRRRRGKKTRCLVCVCVCIIHESCAVRSLNRKFKTKKCKKNFYYTTRVPTVLLQSNFEFRKTVKSCLIVFNEPLTQTTLNKNIVL